MTKIHRKFQSRNNFNIQVYVGKRCTSRPVCYKQISRVLDRLLYKYNDIHDFLYSHTVSFSNFAYVLAKSFEILLHHKQQNSWQNILEFFNKNNAMYTKQKIEHYIKQLECVARPSMKASRLLLSSATMYQLHLSPIQSPLTPHGVNVLRHMATAVLCCQAGPPVSICLQLTINTCTMSCTTAPQCISSSGVSVCTVICFS